MAIIRKNIKSYVIQSNASPTSQSGNADIVCYDEALAIVGNLHFNEDGFGTGSGGYLNNDLIEVFYHFNSLAGIIDILRKQWICYLVVDTDSHLGYVTSDIQTVGGG